MIKTIIELEDYYGNTIYRIETKGKLSEDQINIDGFDFADEDEENILRFQEVEK